MREVCKFGVQRGEKETCRFIGEFEGGQAQGGALIRRNGSGIGRSSSPSQSPDAGVRVGSRGVLPNQVGRWVMLLRQ